MSDTDLELLSRYVGHHAEDAFAKIVRRHLDLVYSAALRQVRSPQLAEEVAQSVFADLSQQACKLKPDTILTAWLYEVTRRTAIDVVRHEARRRVREQIASETNAMNTTTADWTHIQPLLDEAMHALDDTDRAAVLLRYFENKSLRDVGQAFGTSDDAAQKRVSRAVERLREFFAKRGVTAGVTGLVTVISANAVQAAPVGLAASISTAAALAGGTAIATTATKAIAMTTIQKTVVAASLAAAIGTGIFEARQASNLRHQVHTIRQQQAPLIAQTKELQRERDEVFRKLAAVLTENEQLRQNNAEIPRLRGQIARLRTNLASGVSNSPSDMGHDPFTQSVLALAAKAAELNLRLEQMPDKRIPELQLLTENDWLDAATEADLESDAGVRRALSQLRSLAKTRFIKHLSDALANYIAEHNGQLPADPILLKPYLDVPLDDSFLKRYKMLHTGSTNDVPKDAWVITERAPVDRDYDSHHYIGLNHRSGSWGTGPHSIGDPDPEWATRP